MLLAHRIRLDPTPEQRDYFARAGGTARRVGNWAPAEWNRQVGAGLTPNAMALKKQFDRIKYSDPDWHDAEGQPWLRTVHVSRRRAAVSTVSTWSKINSACRDASRDDRDVNAAINLQRLATGAHPAQTALPEASQAVTPGTAAGAGPAGGGQVTPVRHEHGQLDGSGRGEIGEHLCARFR